MNFTFFGCNSSEARSDTGINSFYQGLVYILYNILHLSLFIINLQTAIKMVKIKIFRTYKFLFTTCLVLLAYLFGKFIYFFTDILFCGQYEIKLILNAIPFTLYLFIINIFNYSICIGLLKDFHYRYFQIRKSVTILKNIQLYFLFPLLAIEFISFILTHIYTSFVLDLIQFISSTTIFLMEIILFILFIHFFKLLVEKKEKINNIKSKYRFTFLFYFIVASLIFKILWLTSNTITRLISSNHRTWYGDIRDYCFDTKQVFGPLLYMVDTFCSESLTIIVISIFLKNLFNIEDTQDDLVLKINNDDND